MSNLKKTLLASLAVVGALTSLAAQAEQPRSLACSVSVDNLLNGATRYAYRKDFALLPDVPYSDDFSSATRFRFFDAWSYLEDGKTVVAISYFNDIGVFDSVDFGTSMKINEVNNVDTSSGSFTYSTSQGIRGNHTTNYTLTCTRLKG